MTLSPPKTAQKSAETAVGVLLGDLIDYAGLFPPASLDMIPAVTNYDSYARSKHRGMLGRFIVPAARLGEFEKASSALPTAGKTHWALSVLAATDADIKGTLAFNEKNKRFGVKSVEVKAATIEDIRRLSAIIPREIEAYFEIPLSGDADKYVEAAAACGCRAKIRTGGETADKIPAPEKLAGFLRLCAAAKTPFKATAGLHHPLRSIHRLTYQPDSPSGMMHGFLNVFLAAAFVHAGMEEGAARELLEEQSPAALRFTPAEISWHDYRLDILQLTEARRNFCVSFGSCSFTEPVDDLLSLGLL